MFYFFFVFVHLLKINQLRKENKLNEYRNRRNNISEVISADKNEPTYWSEYKRVHGYLAQKRQGLPSIVSTNGGSGRPSNADLNMYPDRPQYNIFTGERLSTPGWSINGNYRLKSGNFAPLNAKQSSFNLLG